VGWTIFSPIMTKCDMGGWGVVVDVVVVCVETQKDRLGHVRELP
jgi:hypothetical protein